MGAVIEIGIPVALAFIMLSLGIGLTPADFLKIVREPRDVVIGLTCQMLVLPVVAFALVLTWSPPPEIAIGVMILAAAPGGATSNALTAVARGDVALSVSLTAIASLGCLITIPIILGASNWYFLDTSEATEFSVGGVVARIFVMVTIPVLLGMVLRRAATDFAIRIEPHVFRVSASVFFLILAAAIYSQKDNLAAFFTQAGPITLVMNVLIMGIAFGVAKKLATGLRQQMAIAIECGLQNGSMAIAIAMAFYSGSSAVIPAVVYSIIMYVTAASIIVLFRHRPMNSAA